MPNIITRGAMSAKAVGFTGQTGAPPVYVEDVFSTYLYTGTGSDQVLATGIDLSTKGGLVWSKRRSNLAENHFLQDTLRGLTARLSTNNTSAQTSSGAWPMNALSATGMTVSGANYAAAGETYVSWTFREQAKFFDVVTYTGTGSTRTISHALGAAPGMIIVKRTDAVSNWRVYHSGISLPNESWLHLNTTDAAFTSGGTNIWNVTSTTFQADTYIGLSTSGATYVAYLFADSNSGGFGTAGTDSVVACGGFTTDASGNAAVSLGWEPQFLLFKRTSATGNWTIVDNMRGWPVGSVDVQLQANLSNAETSAADLTDPSATGFSMKGISASSDYIYVAIRRGPMKVPTDATKVFNPSFPVAGFPTYVTGFPVDFNLNGDTSATDKYYASSRLTGATYLYPPSTAAQVNSAGFKFDSNVGCIQGWPPTYIGWSFGRAPGYMDVVCYTGNGATNLVSHNLTVKPEAVIIKNRTAADLWPACFLTKGLTLNTTGTEVGVDVSTYFTSTTISVGTGGLAGIYGAGPTNAATNNYVAYLFATCPGVSKVGSYTGTGAAQNINCGFSAGARFVLIKRTDSAGDWYVYDSTRGLSFNNAPYLVLNSTVAEVTGTNYVNAYASGFTVTATAPAGLNASGGAYIYLAIA